MANTNSKRQKHFYHLKVLHERGDKAKLEEAIRKFDVADQKTKTKV